MKESAKPKSRLAKFIVGFLIVYAALITYVLSHMQQRTGSF